MKRKLLYTISLIILIAILVTIFKVGYSIWDEYFNPKTNSLTSEIQIGTQEDDELPGFLDNGTSFENNKQLKVIATYNSHKDSSEADTIIRLYVTKASSNEVVQDYSLNETPELSVISMSLDNMQWDTGEYVVHLKRDGQEVAFKKFVIK